MTLTFDLTLLALVAGDMNVSVELEKDMSQSVSSVQSVNDLENTKYLEKDMSQSVSSVQSVNDLENSKSDTQ